MFFNCDVSRRFTDLLQEPYMYTKSHILKQLTSEKSQEQVILNVCIAPLHALGTDCCIAGSQTFITSTILLGCPGNSVAFFMGLKIHVCIVTATTSLISAANISWL